MNERLIGTFPDEGYQCSFKPFQRSRCFSWKRTNTRSDRLRCQIPVPVVHFIHEYTEILNVVFSFKKSEYWIYGVSLMLTNSPYKYRTARYMIMARMPWNYYVFKFHQQISLCHAKSSIMIWKSSGRFLYCFSTKIIQLTFTKSARLFTLILIFIIVLWI